MADQVTPTYRVTAEPDENGGWFVHAPKVKGANGRGRTIERARASIREVISMVLGVPAESFGIEMDYDLPEHITQKLDRLKKLRQELTKLQDDCSNMTSEAVEQLRPLRLGLRDEASLLGLSFQRVQQITARRPRSSSARPDGLHPATARLLPEVEQICRRFRVRKLELFGSAAAGHGLPEQSDMDLLVEFDAVPGAYADAYFGLLEALEGLFGRPVDLVILSAIKNPYFLETVERQKVLLYAA